MHPRPPAVCPGSGPTERRQSRDDDVLGEDHRIRKVIVFFEAPCLGNKICAVLID
jgi:hypothetical protein